jgi:threonine dehydrogenase-like Zn-dependent dehydrogenase
MNRLIVTGPRQAKFEEVQIPECPDDGLLIRAIVTAISTGTEIRVYRWIPVDPEGKYLHGGMLFPDGPAENGYCMVAEVVEVGKDVEGFTKGERVYSSETHKEYAAVDPSSLLKLPDAIPTEHAAMINVLGVGHIAVRTGKPAVGSNVAILGMGVVGLAALAYCKAFGLRTAAIDMSETRLAIARELGADIAVSPAAPDFQAQMDKLFPEGADIAIEAASTWKAIQTGMDVVGKNGRVVVIARHTDMPHYNLVGHPYLSKRITLHNAMGYDDEGQRWDRAHCMDLTIDMLATGRMDIEPMLTHRINWRELPDIYDRLDKGDQDIVGVIVDWRS